MRNKQNYTYIGISFIVLVFGIIFIPKIIDRITNGDIVRYIRTISTSQPSQEEINKPLVVEKSIDHATAHPREVSNNYKIGDTMMYVEVYGERKKVPNFQFLNQQGNLISNKDYLGKVYVIDFFFTTCPTICPIMSTNLVNIQNEFKDYDDFGIASFTINPTYDTKEVLNNYGEQFGVDVNKWNLMTGDRDAIYELSNVGFNLYTSEDTSVAGGFEHSGNFALIDKEGYIRSRADDFGNPKIYYRGAISYKTKYEYNAKEEEITILKEDILKLLNE